MGETPFNHLMSADLQGGTLQPPCHKQSNKLIQA